MLNQIRYILLFCMVLFCSLSAAAQLAMPDSVCVGSTKHYYVDPNPEPGSTYTWKIDGITQVIYTTNAIDITWNNTGIYLLEVQEQSGNGCFGAFVSGQVFVGSLPAAIAGEDKTICLKESTQIGAENVPGNIYSWSSVPVGFTSSLSNPIVTPLETTTYTVVEIITASGCSNSNSVVVKVNPDVPVSVSIAESENPVCDSTSVTFTARPTNEGTFPVYQWKINGINAGTSNATYSYTPANNDVIICMLASSEICATGNPATSNQVTMWVYPKPIVSAGPDEYTCQNNPYTVEMASALHASSILWSHSGLGILTGATTINPVYIPDPEESGIVILTLTAQGLHPCGPAYDQMNLTLKRTPTGTAGPDHITCPGQSVTITEASAQNYSSMLWTHDGTGTMAYDTTFSPIYTPAPLEQGEVTLTLTLYGMEECSDTMVQRQLTIIIQPSMLVDAGPSQSIPSGTSTWLSGQVAGGSGTYAFEWHPASLLLGHNTKKTETVLLTEPVTFWLTVTDIFSGCKETDSMMVNITAYNLPPVAVDDFDSTRMNIPVTVNILKNDYVPNGIIAIVTLLKGPDNGLVVLNPDSTITYAPFAGFVGIDSLSYFICNNGLPVLCDTATVYIYVGGYSIGDSLVIYNVITPNGDGVNDRWIIDGIKRFPDNTVIIFNRWGDKIYDYDRYDNETVVWKGTDRQGNLVPDGTYYYILTIKDGGSWNGWVFVRRGGN